MVLSEFKILYRTHRLHIICLLSLEQILGSEIDVDMFLPLPAAIQECILRNYLGESFDLIPLIESIQQVSQTCVEYVSFP